jgi:hypothetical protein
MTAELCGEIILAMPKKLKELAELNIGTRHRLVLEAMEKYGLATVADVLNYVCAQKSIDLKKENVKASLKKTIENDLKSLTGTNNKLGVKYYLRDNSTEVSINQVEENTDGSIKNKYNIKYYIIGGDHQVPGLSLLADSDVEIEFPRKSIMDIRIDPAYEINKSENFNIVFQKNGDKFYSVNFKPDEIPIGFVICRSYKETTPFDLIGKEFGLRNFKINLGHASIDRYLPEIRVGHAYIKITADNTIEIQDLNSLNGTYYSPVSKNMADLMFSKKITFPGRTAKTKAKITYSPRPSVDEDIENLSFDSVYPFHNEYEWQKIREKVQLEDGRYLIKVGAFIFFIGKYNRVVGGGGKSKVKSTQ